MQIHVVVETWGRGAANIGVRCFSTHKQAVERWRAVVSEFLLSGCEAEAAIKLGNPVDSPLAP